MEMTIKDYLTLAIATYAAFVSTLTLIWNLVKAYKEKGKLKVTAAICKNEEGYTRDVDAGEDGDMLRIEVVNLGKEDITISGIYFLTKRPKPWLFWKKRPHCQFKSVPSCPLPHTLESSKQIQWLYESDLLLPTATIKRFLVKDTQGKSWYIPRSQVKRMTKVIQHMKKIYRRRMILLSAENL